MVSKLFVSYQFAIDFFNGIFNSQGVASLTSPELDGHPILSASEMPEVHEGNPVPSSSSSSKDNKASNFTLRLKTRQKVIRKNKL